MDPRLEAKLAAHQATIAELERTGQYDNPNIDRQAIMSALMDGPQDAHQKQQLAAFADMVEIGNPDTNMEALDDPNTKWDETPAPFGMKAEDLRKSMLDGYEGRGWSQDDVDKAGRMPRNRELSPGSRQFQEIDRRNILLKRLIDSQASPEQEPNTHGHITPSSRVSDTSFGPARISKEAVRDRAVKEFDRTRGQKFGESGYMGAMENPEYLAGRVMNNVLNPMVDRLQYYIHDGDSMADSRVHRDERQAALAASRAVSPLLPYNPEGYEEKDKAFNEVRGIADKISPISYDQHYRQKTGAYPSLAGSHLATFAENLVDPMTALTVGSGIAKTAVKGEVGAIGKSLLLSNAEEPLMYGGLVGGMTAATPGAAKSLPNPFQSGNLARTDLYKQYEPTGEFRPETPGEFDKSMADRAAEKLMGRGQLESWKRNTPKSPYAKQ